MHVKKIIPRACLILIFPLMHILICSTPLMAFGEMQPSEIMKKYKDSVVVFSTKDESGNTQAVATGFIVTKNGTILTSYHVLAGIRPLIIELANGQRYENAGVVSYNKQNDFAVLRVDGKNLTPIKLALELPNVGEKVVVIGNPKGLLGSISDGLFSGRREVDGGTRIQISAPISPGSSGSPVFNLKGEAIGIAAGTWVNGQSLNWAIPIELVKNLIDDKVKSKIEDVPLDTEEQGLTGGTEKTILLSTDEFMAFLSAAYIMRAEVNDLIKMNSLKVAMDLNLGIIQVNDELYQIQKKNEEAVAVFVSIRTKDDDLNQILLHLIRDHLEFYAANKLLIDGLTAISKGDVEGQKALQQSRLLKENIGVETDELVAKAIQKHKEIAAKHSDANFYFYRMLLPNEEAAILNDYLSNRFSKLGLILSDARILPTVLGTEKASPARFARLYTGDVIVGIENGEKFKNVIEFYRYLATKKAGDEVNLLVRDNGEIKSKRLSIK